GVSACCALISTGWLAAVGASWAWRGSPDRRSCETTPCAGLPGSSVTPRIARSTGSPPSGVELRDDPVAHLGEPIETAGKVESHDGDQRRESLQIVELAHQHAAIGGVEAIAVAGQLRHRVARREWLDAQLFRRRSEGQ